MLGTNVSFPAIQNISPASSKSDLCAVAVGSRLVLSPYVFFPRGTRSFSGRTNSRRWSGDNHLHSTALSRSASPAPRACLPPTALSSLSAFAPGNKKSTLQRKYMSQKTIAFCAMVPSVGPKDLIQNSRVLTLCAELLRGNGPGLLPSISFPFLFFVFFVFFSSRAVLV